MKGTPRLFLGLGADCTSAITHHGVYFGSVFSPVCPFTSWRKTEMIALSLGQVLAQVHYSSVSHMAS